MRFLHTADWQIGMRAAHAGARAAEVREARLRAAERVVELAAGADLLLLAGDTFEDNAVDPVVVRRVVDILARAKCPVFVLPGNHDPLGAGSVFHHPAWREAAPEVRVLDAAVPVEVGDAVLLPVPCASKWSSEDPTEKLPRWEGPPRVRIGVAHGSLRGQGFEVAGDDYPIAENAAARAGVDYLALGHWHSTLILPSPEAARLAYPGTHETTKFGERMSGHALRVTIERPGAPARAEVLETGTLRWIDRDVELALDEDVARLRAELDQVAEPTRALVRLRLSGALGRAGWDAVDALGEALASRFLSARVERETLALRPESAADWAGTLPDGVVRSVAERLLAQAQESDPARREVALTALARLTAMVRRAT
jgi:DNA repair exonuclease SbcCD nuclease subunit